MNKRILETLDEQTTAYLKMLIEDDVIMQMWHMGIIHASYKYIDDWDVFLFVAEVSAALSALRAEQKQYVTHYTRLCKSDIIVENGGENE